MAKHLYLLLGDQSSPSIYKGIIADFDSIELSKVEQTSFSLLLADLQPIIDETSKSLGLSDYSLETDSFLKINMSLLEFQYFVKILVILAREQADKGMCDEALRTALLPLRMIKRPEQSFALIHLVAIAITGYSVNSINEVCAECDHSDQYENALQSLNELRKHVFPGDIENWWHEELVALRYAAAYGYPVNLSPQMQSGIVRQYDKLQSLEYGHWLVKKFPYDDWKSIVAKESIAKANPGPRVVLLFDDFQSFDPLFFEILTGLDPVLARQAVFVMDMDEAKTRAYVALAKFDLTRIWLVGQLGNDAQSTTVANMSPIPTDPFTSAPFLISPIKGTQYSIGPDGVDNYLGVSYDATNGTLSDGDLWIEKVP